MPPPAPDNPPPAREWLRRADQATVAGLVLLALVSLGAWYVSRGGLQGGLVEFDHAAPRTAQFQVDINQADWAELTQLPEVGETLARRIVAHRREHGPFADHDDLSRVRGIGPLTMARIRPFLLPIADREATAARD